MVHCEQFEKFLIMKKPQKDCLPSRKPWTIFSDKLISSCTPLLFKTTVATLTHSFTAFLMSIIQHNKYLNMCVYYCKAYAEATGITNYISKNCTFPFITNTFAFINQYSILYKKLITILVTHMCVTIISCWCHVLFQLRSWWKKKIMFSSQILLFSPFFYFVTIVLKETVKWWEKLSVFSFIQVIGIFSSSFRN